MAANVIFLSRSGSRQFYKYSACTNVVMTGQTASYGSVTGVAATNVITIPGSAPIDGSAITFTSLTGGAGLVTGTKYYVINATGATVKLATSQGGTAIDFTTDITAATVLVQTDDLLVWSSEFRDIFSSNISSANVSALSVTNSFSGPGTDITLSSDATTPDMDVITSAAATQSDEAAHAPLRQTQLARSYWKFTMSTAPTTLWAEVMEGDVLSDTAPNTP